MWSLPLTVKARAMLVNGLFEVLLAANSYFCNQFLPVVPPDTNPPSTLLCSSVMLVKSISWVRLIVVISLFAIALERSAKLSTLAVCSSVAAGVATLLSPIKASNEPLSLAKSLTFKVVVALFLSVAFSSLAAEVASEAGASDLTASDFGASDTGFTFSEVD